MAKNAETYEYTEQEKVIDWRIECLNLAGVPPETSQLLALSDHDLHVMVEAALGGCKEELMLQIFGEPIVTKSDAEM